MNKAALVDSTQNIYEKLQALWCDLLERAEVGILDDFFQAGGTSMQVIEMLWTVSVMYGRSIDHMEFYKEPCIRRLVELLSE